MCWKLVSGTNDHGTHVSMHGLVVWNLGASIDDEVASESPHVQGTPTIQDSRFKIQVNMPGKGARLTFIWILIVFFGKITKPSVLKPE